MDDKLEASGSGTGGSWTDERISMLRQLWERGLTASEIADTLGGVSRNAVIGKAHRIGLKSRPSPVKAGRVGGVLFHLERVGDPLLPAMGASIPATDLFQLAWREGITYLDASLQRVIALAAAFARDRRRRENPSEITATELAWAITASNPRVADSGFRELLPNIDPAFAETATKGPLATAEHCLLRWDAVEILAYAAGLRAKVLDEPTPLEPHFVAAALVCTSAGQAGLFDARLGDETLEPFRRFTASWFDTYVGGLKDPLRRGLASQVVKSILEQNRFQRRVVERAGYASDAVGDGGSDPDIRKDARVLADLILLEAAAPPLAIGVFGPWGSGKSTLLSALRAEVAEQASSERAIQNARPGEHDAAVRKVTAVMQLELNAWSFADSENLWASLTSDIFEQIAAGGKDAADARIGARLISEVAERTSEEAATLRAAQAQLQESRARVKAADDAIAAAKLDENLGIIDASFDVVRDMLGAVPAAKSDKADENSADSDAEAPDCATSSEAAEKKETGSSAIDVFRKAVLVGDDVEADLKIKEYSKAGGPVARLISMCWDYIKSRPVKFVAVGVLSLLGAIGLSLLVRASLPELSTWGRWIGQLGAPALILLGPAFYYLLPAIKAAGQISSKLKEKRQAAQERQIKAQGERRQAEIAASEAEKAQKRSREIVEKYAGVREIGATPGLMLDFLLEDSAEIAKLRGSLGTLGTVRRAFEKLNRLIADGADDPDHQLQRIIIYIDDLDRCSEQQVVDILAAIHLLLAFPCFVVVAAVDARWLERALTHVHEPLGRQDSQVTAIDYLEKIFQIPYWVRPLRSNSNGTDGGSYGRLIAQLAGETVEASSIDIEVESDPDPADETPKIFEVRRVEPFAPEEESEATADKARLRLSASEIDYFKELGPLAARSPRSVKRMMNLYRLIRVDWSMRNDILHVADADSDAVPACLVQFALACEAGLPPEANIEIGALLANLDFEEFDAWLEFDLDADAPPRLSLVIADDGQLRAFLAGLNAAVQRLPDGIDLDLLQKAFALAARYSFRRP